MPDLCHASRLRARLRNLVVVTGAAGMLTAGLQACGGNVVDEGTVLKSETGAECVLGAREGEPGTYCSFTPWYVSAKGAGCSSLSCNDICGVSGSIGCPYDSTKERFTCNWYCVVDGRRHASSVELDDEAPLHLGDHFARMAYHEAIAVQAFERLRRDLRVLGAPRALIVACSRAIEDERRHVRMASGLARKFGRAPLVPPSCAPMAPRTALELASENGREGCGRELLGVFVGEWHATHAEHRVVRRFYARITADEARHASLSVRLQRWLRGRLSEAERAAVDHEALSFVRAAVVQAPTALGVPPAALVERVTRCLAEDLPLAWAA